MLHMLHSLQTASLRWFVVAAFCFGFRRSHWWSLGWELRQDESFLLRLPAVERRAFQLFPLNRCRWPGPWSTTGTRGWKPLWGYSDRPDLEMFSPVVFDTYTPAGLAGGADGEAVCSRAKLWPGASPGTSAGPSARGSRGDGMSPVGDTQDKFPLLA